LLPTYARQISTDNASLLAIRLQGRRGLALARQGKTDEGTNAFDQALSLAQELVGRTPQWAQGRFELALVYAARGDRAKAESEFAAATQCDQSLVAARARAEADLEKLR
jgi:tetratricopeptide (TPR) repeat protein